MRKVLLIALGIVFAFAGSSMAFHDHGVADCQGCHTMHNSQDGALVDPNSPDGNQYLLKDATPSDVCLSCHATRLGADISSTPLTPANQKGAGNFIFLLEDNLNDGHNGGAVDSLGNLIDPVPGYTAGHSIVAPGYGLDQDPVLASAPGGNYSSSILGCSSCHDPHGNTNFRMLYGIGAIQDGAFTFTNAAPTALGISPTSGSATESNANHTAYQGGWSAWCGNCHGDFHNNGTKLIHPSNEAIGGTIAQNYNLYAGTDAITGGNAATAYLAAVPFEDASVTTTSTAGPTASSRVMCLSCHRAHATSAPDAGRWDFQLTYLAEDGVESGSYAIPNPYGHNQRSLCNKCHVKDINDGPNPN